MPHRPAVAVEVVDMHAGGLVARAAGGLGRRARRPGRAGRRKAVEPGADLIALKLRSCHPDQGDRSAADAVRDRSSACSPPCGVPLIVYGPGTADKDNEVLVAVAEATKGEQLALGLCEDKNYRTIVAAALGNGHLVIAQTPIDVNLAKQLNILISDMGLPLERVLMDPNTGALGYGLEYTYSVMERLRLAALMGDAMTQQPMICTAGEEAWRQKEGARRGRVPEAWGELAERGVAWEVTTATTLLEAGADIAGAAPPALAWRRARGHRRPHEGSLSDGPHRTRDLQAPAQDQLQGVRLPHLPRLRHEAGPEGHRARQLPLRERRGQGGARRRRRRRPSGWSPSAPASAASRSATRWCSSGTRRPSTISRASSCASRATTPTWPSVARPRGRATGRARRHDAARSTASPSSTPAATRPRTPRPWPRPARPRPACRWCS